MYRLGLFGTEQINSFHRKINIFSITITIIQRYSQHGLHYIIIIHYYVIPHRVLKMLPPKVGILLSVSCPV